MREVLILDQSIKEVSKDGKLAKILLMILLALLTIYITVKIIKDARG